jgi:transmembrane sensor
MKNKEAKDLIQKFKNSQTTDEEENKLKYWLHNLNEDKASDLSEIELEQAGEEVWNRIPLQGNRKQISFYQPWFAAAAIILMMLSIGRYFYLTNRENKKPVQQVAVNPIMPGGNKAILTLANGKKIILNSAADGELAKQSGMTIKKTAAGRIVYTVTANTGDANAPVTYNTIETPIGGQYEVVLSDGSLVWLNAATKLRFPTKFIGGERKVELSGEGYFEIEHNKAMPFKVLSRQQEITVLGTHFNVSNYADEPVVKTVLLQGSVKVTLVNKENTSALLKPGQQATLMANNFTVSKTDTTAAVAWKNGLFRFDDEELGSIMRKVSRWYNVRIIYDDDKLKEETFGGVIQRFSNVTDLLKMLESVGKVKFKVEGNQIRIMESKSI